MTPLVVRAHAKINLDLRIAGRRPDGFHELRTIFQSLALHDTVVVRSVRGAFGISCDMPDVPVDRTNLVWRAADAMWRAAGRRGRIRGVAIELRKRVPAQAGLGGGSSDAAATLVALDAAWRLHMAPARLLEIAATLGSDVPFFLVGGTALGLGRGELLYPLPDLPATAVLLVRPPFGVSTADAYRWFRDAGPAARVQIQRVDLPGHPSGLHVANDLEPAVVARHPVIGQVRRALAAAGARVALMSGSGSAVFGLFDEPDRAWATARRFDRPGWPTWLTATAGRRRARPAAR